MTALLSVMLTLILSNTDDKLNCLKTYERQVEVSSVSFGKGYYESHIIVKLLVLVICSFVGYWHQMGLFS